MSKNMKIELHSEYKYGEQVQTILDDGVDPIKYMVVSLQINMDKSVVYGCTDMKGEWHWFKGYEIKRYQPDSNLGFEIVID